VQTSFTPRQDEIEWATKFARSADSRLALLVQLKCFHFLRHFPPSESIPEDIVEHVSASLGMTPVRTISYANPTALYRHHKVIRELLGIEAYTDAETRPLPIALAHKAAAVVETRVDIINCVIEDLIRQGHELPVFRTLDDIAEQVHADAQTALHLQIEEQLSDVQRRWLDKLLVTDLPLRRTLYNQLKQAAKKTSRQHLDMLLDQVRWLDGLPACDDLLSAVPAIKLKHMAERGPFWMLVT
jgi:hypothetical protein